VWVGDGRFTSTRDVAPNVSNAQRGVICRTANPIATRSSSLTAAEPLAKLLRSPVRDDRVTLRGRMEGAAYRAAIEIEHAEGTSIEVELRPLIDSEKGVVECAEESRAASVRLETPWRKREERRWIAGTGVRERARPRHVHGFSDVGFGRAA
jgi:hypothetical protein